MEVPGFCYAANDFDSVTASARTLRGSEAASGAPRLLVALEIARARDLEAGLHVRLHAAERPRRHVAPADAPRELALLGIVLRRQRPELAVDDAERVHRYERPEAQPPVGE